MKRIIFIIGIFFALSYSASCQDIKIPRETFDTLVSHKSLAYVGHNEFLSIHTMSYVVGFFKEISFNKLDSVLAIKGSLYDGSDDFSPQLKNFVILSGIFEVDTLFKNEKPKTVDSDSIKRNEEPINKRRVENIVSKTAGIMKSDKFIPNTKLHFSNTTEFKINIKIKTVNDVLCFVSEDEDEKNNEHDAEKNGDRGIIIKSVALFYDVGKLLK